MDRSFLSQPTVITASREFVCIRLATYENKSEAALLKTVFRSRSGALENTVFAILSPDGRRQLVRSGRSPRFAFFGPEETAAREMARTMNRISAQFKVRRQRKAATPPLPLLADLRLAVNVAACDNQPLVVAYAPKASDRAKLEKRLAKLAWSDHYIGQFLYVSTGDAKGLKKLAGDSQPRSGIYVIEPDEFGQTGKVIVQVDAVADETKLRDGLALAVVTHQKLEKDMHRHNREGRSRGIFWKTRIPVTDPKSLGIKQRGKRRSPR